MQWNSPLLHDVNSAGSKRCWHWMQACLTATHLKRPTIIQHDWGEMMRWCFCVSGCFKLWPRVATSGTFRESRVSFVLRAVWRILAWLSLGYTQLVWQQLISAPGRFCSSRLSYPSHGTIPIVLKWRHTCTSKKYVIFAQICGEKKKKQWKKILLHHQKGKTRVFIPMETFLYSGSKNRKKDKTVIIGMKGVRTEHLKETTIYSTYRQRQWRQ